MVVVVHISGFPGSGKTTLGEKIQKIFKTKVAVCDTDGFIQHHNQNGKKLLQLEKEVNSGRKTENDYYHLWEEIIRKSIHSFIEKHQEKLIIFIGSLDNFSISGNIYQIHADYKFFLDLPLDQIMKRYYLRIAEREKKLPKKEADNYWKNLSKNVYHISSSSDIIKDYSQYLNWHQNHNYSALKDQQIIERIRKLLKKEL